MPQVTVSLAYADVEGATRWLCDTFGFVERTTARVAHEGTLYHAELEVGATGLVMLGPPFSDRDCPVRRGGTTCMVVAYVDDVDAHFRRTRDAGATIHAEPEETFYGDRTYRAADLEGHHWMFAEHVRDVPPEEWDWTPSTG